MTPEQTEESLRKFAEEAQKVKLMVLGDDTLHLKGAIQRIEDVEKAQAKMNLRIAAVSGAMFVVGYVIDHIFRK